MYLKDCMRFPSEVRFTDGARAPLLGEWQKKDENILKLDERNEDSGGWGCRLCVK